MQGIDERYVRAARELLRWTQGRLAAEAGLSLTTVKRFEADGAMSGSTEDAILAALVEAGVVFLPADESADPPLAGAVALKASAVPDGPPPKRVYNYKAARRGRPRKGG